MEEWEREPIVAGRAGSDTSFLVQLALLLAGVGIIYVFRSEVEKFSADPDGLRSALGALSVGLVASARSAAPTVAAVVLGCAGAVFTYFSWRAGPMAVPHPRPGKPRVSIGRTPGRRRRRDLPPGSLWDHWLVVGRSRFGKSHHAAGVALQYLESGSSGLVVLDPHDELCRSIVGASLPTLRGRQVAWLSFGARDAACGLNVLQRLPGESPANAAERFVSVIDWLYFAGQSLDHQRCTMNIRIAAWAVASVNGLLPDCRVFLTDARYRRAVAARVRDEFLLQAIDEYNRSLGRDPTWPQSALNRLSDILDNEALRRIVAQPTTFDPTLPLDGQGVLLVSFDETTLGEKGVFLLAGTLLHILSAHLKRRPKDDHFHRNPKLRLFLDEAQKVQVGLLKGMIGELAGRGLALTLLTQGLTQYEDPKFVSYVLNNFGTYSVFAVSDDEAELLATELFTRGSSKLGALDERGRPVHFLSVQEQLAEAKRLLTQQGRRRFVAKTSTRLATSCESFELRPRASAAEVEEFRHSQLRRFGRPAHLVDEALGLRLRSLRQATHEPPRAQPPSKDGPVSPPGQPSSAAPPPRKPRARSRRRGSAEAVQDSLL